ncbi:ankyrin repeat-containing domain protein, partial [Immersiella caudata]
GRTALHHAAIRNHVSITQSLISVPKIHLNIPDNRNWTPITYSAALGHTTLFSTLLAAFPPSQITTILNTKDNQGRTTLSWAAGQGNSDVVKLLLAIPGIDVNATDGDNWTPLTYAVAHGHTETVKALL